MAAYHEALVEALATIREEKAEELEGTSFMAIPHNTLSLELEPDHSIMVKTRPKKAAELMDRYRKIVGSLFHSYKVLVADRRTKLGNTTIAPRAEQASGSRYSPTPEPIHYPVIPPSETEMGESSRNSVEPSVPEQENSYGLSGSESPIGNSEGWDYDYYTGTWEHPIPVYDSAGDGDQNQNPGVAAYAADGADAMIIDISSDEEAPVEAQPAHEVSFDHSMCTSSTCFGEAGPSQGMSVEETREYLRSFVEMDGLYLGETLATETSDTNFIPSGRPYVPDTVRRTTRHTGWTPGMFFEQ